MCSAYPQIASTCFKCINPLNNLNIEFSSSNLVFMWNKYQIFVYEGSFESPTKIFVPEYQVYRLVVAENSFLCLDTNGFVHVVNSTEKVQLHLPRQPKAQDIKACVNYGQNVCLSLKYESEGYYLYFNKISSDYQELKKVKLIANNSWPLQDNDKDKYIVTHKKIDENCHGVFQELFKTKLTTNTDFIAISFDKFTVYGCLCDLNEREEEIKLVKIIACPAEIRSIDIVGTERSFIVIALKMGTVLQLTLNHLSKCPGPFPTGISTEVIHLNSMLHKFVVFNDTFLYTDGTIMWRADDAFSKDIKFKEFYIKNVNDFITSEDNLICTTFNKMIYKVGLNDSVYYNAEKNNYTSAANVLKNSEIITKIFKEIERCKSLAEDVSIEGSYIAAMSLSKRQEMMDTAISVSVMVCSSFAEVLQDIQEELVMPEDISKYLENNGYLFLIKVKLKEDAPGGLSTMITDIINNSDIDIHVSLSNDTKVIKTASMEVSKLTQNFLIPHHIENDIEINVNVRVVARLPSTFDNNENIWVELYSKDIKKTAEHFIQRVVKTPLLKIKQRTEDFEQAILKCSSMDRKQFKFYHLATPCNPHVLYMQLPRTFIISDFDKHFNKMKALFMIEMLNDDEFLSSKKQVSFIVGKENVELFLDNDGFSTPRLKILSSSSKLAGAIRDFLSDVIYGDNGCEPGQEFIKLSFYTTVENIQKEVKELIEKSASFDKVLAVKQKFEKDIIGLLPI